MAYSDATSSQKTVIVVNGILRLLQLTVGAVTIGLYAWEKGYWLDSGISSKITFELVLGSLAIVTGLALGITPFRMSYRPVALAWPWDLVMFLMYSAALGYMRAVKAQLYSQRLFRTKGPYDPEVYLAHALAMARKLWVNLAGMGVFLCSAGMGAALIWIGRRNGRRGGGGKHSAV
ncbi:hypothetical protein CLAIMM_11897 [Cladophialophora immunda]|nr:hypothetical protein CLAIMM_11897 [Cladophialophora immunda]